MRLVVVTDTFLKLFPDPISQFRKLKRPGQAILLKKGTKLEITEYFLLENGTSRTVNNHILIRLAMPSEVVSHQNRCWFVEEMHVEIQNMERQSDAPGVREALPDWPVAALQENCVSQLDNSPPKRLQRTYSGQGKRKDTQRKPKLANPMDSFLGLVLTPPVTAKGRYYPFGRIAYSSCSLGEREGRSPQAMSELSQFFMVQKIQLPFGLHTDWLIVDRVSEVVSFLPADNDKGFRVLVASPLSAKIILKGLADNGLANTVMFEGVERADYKNLPGTYRDAETSIRDILQDRALWEANQRYQRYMDNNIQTLRENLDIKDRHLMSVPVLFHPPLKSGRTAAYFPNMINYRLLKDGSLLAPRPKGPVVNGKCVFETVFEHVVSPRRVLFTDLLDAVSYGNCC